MGESERFMPPGYAEKLQAARRARAMSGERRIITMLFCDVVGSTAMAGQLDPEEWAEIMNEAFEYLITPIYCYEGTVARLHLYAGDVAQAAKLLEEPAAQSEWVRVDSNTGLIFAAVEALVGFARGRHEVILGRLKQAIARAERMGLVIWLIELWLLQGKAYLGLGRTVKAAAVLTKARAAAEESGSRKLLWQVLGALAEISDREREGEQADELRQAMVAEIAYVAGHIADEQLRGSFLARARGWRIHNQYED